MEDRNVKSVDFEQGDLVQQLREKIRTQAQRLRNLEQYRLLCEQRINELYPGHNFPVKPEDLGTHQSPSSTQELLMAKQKIARLEQQLSQTNIKVPLTDNYTFPKLWYFLSCSPKSFLNFSNSKTICFSFAEWSSM